MTSGSSPTHSTKFMPQLQVELSNLPVVREGGMSRQPIPQLNKQFEDLAALALVINATIISS